jgi:hypothetical protein
VPYYSAGDYYQGDYYQGDNYGAFQAGGLLKSLGKIVGGVARGVVGSIPGVGGVVNALLPQAPRIQGLGSTQIVPVPGFGGAVSRALPGGESGFMVAPRRRINPLNIKALRRAMRRAKGFERQARRVGSFFNPGKSYRLKGRRPRKRA